MIKETQIDNLSVITAGKIYSNPSELLSSQRMLEFIKKLKSDYDMVIFDTPPVIAVTDSRVLANEVDALVLVVKSGHTIKYHLKRTLELLQSVNAPNIGCILNSFDRSHNYYGDYDYYYEYYYSSHLNEKDGLKEV